MQWSHSGGTMHIITLMCLPLSLNLQPQKCFLFQSVRFQPVIPNSAQHLHFLQEFCTVTPFAVGYFDLTASIHCLAVYVTHTVTLCMWHMLPAHCTQHDTASLHTSHSPIYSQSGELSQSSAQHYKIACFRFVHSWLPILLMFRMLFNKMELLKYQVIPP